MKNMCFMIVSAWVSCSKRVSKCSIARIRPSSAALAPAGSALRVGPSTVVRTALKELEESLLLEKYVSDTIGDLVASAVE